MGATQWLVDRTVEQQEQEAASLAADALEPLTFVVFRLTNNVTSLGYWPSWEKNFILSANQYERFFRTKRPFFSLFS